jgi:HlyD family type I secretion membrane fusion protein
VSERREKYYALTDQLSRVVLRSPVDGVINNINYHTIGSTIPGGQPIMEISPTDDHLVIEAKVPPKNIDSIHVGLKSMIRFSAFKSRTTPLFTGTVVSLSPDIIIDPRQQMDPNLAGGYYLAKIEIDMDEFNEVARTRKIELHPGMQAEVQIVTGTRTLLRYLLDPVFDAMFKGFKEK